jgi:hypothetical protein
MRLHLLAPLVLALAACASNEPVQPVAAVAPAPAASGAVQVASAQKCHRETRTGSNLYQTVCEPDVSTAQRMNNQEEARRMTGMGAAVNQFSTGH